MLSLLFVFAFVISVSQGDRIVSVSPKAVLSNAGVDLLIVVDSEDGVVAVSVNGSDCVNLVFLPVDATLLSGVEGFVAGESNGNLKQMRCELPGGFLEYELAPVTVHLASGTSNMTDVIAYCPVFIAPEITSVSPLYGNADGGTNITIRGQNLGQDPTDILKISVGGNNQMCTNIQFHDSTSVSCLTPSGVDGTSHVTVETRCGGIALQTTRFYYVSTARPTIKVNSVDPPVGTNGGGTQVMLDGFGFRNFGTLMRCKIGEIEGSAEIRVAYGENYNAFNNTRIGCTTPPHCQLPSTCEECSTTFDVCLSSCLATTNQTTTNNNCVVSCQTNVTECSTACGAEADRLLAECLSSGVGTAVVSFALNGRDFTTDQVTFYYHSTLEVSAISPTEGPLGGGTWVEVSVTGRIPVEMLNLNNFTNVTTAVDNNSTVNSTVEVESSRINSTHFGLSDLKVNLNPICRFGAQVPDQSHQHPNSSATIRHFPKYVDVPAILEFDAEGNIVSVQCQSPPQTTIGRVFVVFSLNGKDFTEESYAVRFDYYDNWSVPDVTGTFPSPRFLHTLSQFETGALLFGGFGVRDVLQQGGSTEMLNDLFELRTDARPPPYYPSEDSSDLEWVQLHDKLVTGTFPTPRSYHTASVLNHKHLLVFGGLTKTRIVYDLNFVDYVEGLKVDTTELRRDVIRNAYKIPEEIATTTDHWRVVHERTENLLKQRTIRTLPSIRTQKFPPESGTTIVQNETVSTNIQLQYYVTLNEIHVYDIVGRAWVSGISQVGDIPHKRMGHTSTVVGSDIFVFGGWSLFDCFDFPTDLMAHTLQCAQSFNDLFKLQPNLASMEMVWEELSPGGEIPAARYGHTTTYTILESKPVLVVFGGMAETPHTNPSDSFTLSGTPQDELYIYDIDANTWSKVLRTVDRYKPTGRSLHTLTFSSVQNAFVLFGGRHNGAWVNDTHVLKIKHSRCDLTLADAESIGFQNCHPYSRDSCYYQWTDSNQTWTLETLNSTTCTTTRINATNSTGNATYIESCVTETTDPSTCGDPTFCCAISNSGSLTLCPETAAVADECARGFWEELRGESQQTPGIRSGHAAIEFLGEIYVFGGSAGTLHPNSLHLLNLRKQNREVRPATLYNTSLFSSCPLTTDHHLRYEFDDPFLYTLWDPDRETICLDDDARWFCQETLPAPAAGAEDRLAFEILDNAPSTPNNATEYNKYLEESWAKELASSLLNTKLTQKEDTEFVESGYGFTVYNPTAQS